MPVIQNNPGFPCPECGFAIKISIKQLLYESRFKCPGCGLVLEMDRRESRKSLEALQQINVAMDNAEKVKKQSL